MSTPCLLLSCRAAGWCFRPGSGVLYGLGARQERSYQGLVLLVPTAALYRLNAPAGHPVRQGLIQGTAALADKSCFFEGQGIAPPPGPTVPWRCRLDWFQGKKSKGKW